MTKSVIVLRRLEALTHHCQDVGKKENYFIFMKIIFRNMCGTFRRKEDEF